MVGTGILEALITFLLIGLALPYSQDLIFEMVSFRPDTSSSSLLSRPIAFLWDSARVLVGGFSKLVGGLGEIVFLKLVCFSLQLLDVGHQLVEHCIVA